MVTKQEIDGLKAKFIEPEEYDNYLKKGYVMAGIVNPSKLQQSLDKQRERREKHV